MVSGGRFNVALLQPAPADSSDLFNMLVYSHVAGLLNILVYSDGSGLYLNIDAVYRVLVLLYVLLVDALGQSQTNAHLEACAWKLETTADTISKDLASIHGCKLEVRVRAWRATALCLVLRVQLLLGARFAIFHSLRFLGDRPFKTFF